MLQPGRRDAPGKEPVASPTAATLPATATDANPHASDASVRVLRFIGVTPSAPRLTVARAGIPGGRGTGRRATPPLSRSSVQTIPDCPQRACRYRTARGVDVAARRLAGLVRRRGPEPVRDRGLHSVANR